MPQNWSRTISVHQQLEDNLENKNDEQKQCASHFMQRMENNKVDCFYYARRYNHKICFVTYIKWALLDINLFYLGIHLIFIIKLYEMWFKLFEKFLTLTGLCERVFFPLTWLKFNIKCLFISRKKISTKMKIWPTF